jgi:hypothetical protein
MSTVYAYSVRTVEYTVRCAYSRVHSVRTVGVQYEYSVRTVGVQSINSTVY